MSANILLGLGIGDSLGAPYERLGSHRNQTPTPIDQIAGDHFIRRQSRWSVAGYPTDDTLLALVLSKALVVRGKLHPEWESRYLHLAFTGKGATNSMGHQTKAVYEAIQNGTYPGAVPYGSEANGSIMCVAPIVLLPLPLEDRVQRARAFSQLTHPGPVTADVNEAFIRLLDDPTGVKPCDLPADPNGPSKGWCRLALAVAQNAASRVLDGEDPVDALRWVISLGGDTDTSAAVAGALIGSIPGVEWPVTLLDKLSARDRLIKASETLKSAL